MRKTKSIILLILVFLFSLNGCSSNQFNLIPVSNNELQLEESFLIKVDPRIELLSIVQYLSDFRNKDDMINDGELVYNGYEKYIKDVEEYFSKYKDHDVVSLYEEMSMVGLGYDKAPQLILYLSDDLNEIDNKTMPYTEIVKTVGSKNIIKKFIKELKKFSNDSNFPQFYKEHKDFYLDLVLNAEKQLKSINAVEKFLDFYGTKQGNFTIIIVPLYIGGYGIKIPYNEKEHGIYGVLPPVNDTEGFSSWIWHEFSHSYVDSFTEKNRKEINKYSDLYNPIKVDMIKQAYGNWQTTVNEHIVRAVTVKLVVDTFGKEYEEKHILHNKNRGFAYIEPIYAQLEEFENNREKYKTFEDFYPRLMMVFEELSKKD